MSLKNVQLISFVFGIATASAVALIYSPSVMAAGNEYQKIFPHNFMAHRSYISKELGEKGKPAAMLAVGRDNTYIKRSNVNMRIYIDKPDTNVLLYINDFNVCSSRGDPIYPSQLTRNRNLVDFKINNGAGGTVSGTFQNNSAGCQARATMVIDKGQFKRDSSTELYYVSFTAKVASGANGFVNTFQLVAPSERVIIAPEGRESSQNTEGSAVMMEQRNDMPRYARYEARFGSDCKVTKKKRVAIDFYDLDNIQRTRDGSPTSSGGGNDAQFGYSVFVSLTAYPRGSSNGTLVRLYGGPGFQRPADPNAVTPPADQQNQSYTVSFDAMPDMRYMLTIDRVYENNTIQFTLPFDGIHWNVPCDEEEDEPTSTTVRPELNLRSSESFGADTLSGGTIEEGDDIYVHARLRNTGPSTGRVSFLRQVWWERGTNEKYDSSDYSINAVGGNRTIDSGDYSPIERAFREASLADGRRKLCARLEVNPRNLPLEKTTVVDSPITKCVLIGKTPTFQAWGSDIRVGGSAIDDKSYGIQAITKDNNSGRRYGSWGEYGVFTRGTIDRLASAASFKRGSAGTAINKLTFANTSGSDGLFGNTDAIGPVVREQIKSYARYQPGADNVYGSLGAAGSLSNVDKTKIIRTAGTVTINNNITYADTASGADGIPQVVIIADSIRIRSNVQTVDAWLIADNTIDTCYNVPDTQLRATRCNQQLTINGPVVADQLKLKRSYTGSSTSPTGYDKKAIPAEIINLRSDAYIWAREQYVESGVGSMRTSYISELPPRY